MVEKENWDDYVPKAHKQKASATASCIPRKYGQPRKYFKGQSDKIDKRHGPKTTRGIAKQASFRLTAGTMDELMHRLDLMSLCASPVVDALIRDLLMIPDEEILRWLDEEHHECFMDAQAYAGAARRRKVRR